MISAGAPVPEPKFRPEHPLNYPPPAPEA
ncbi:hypothetical protein EC01288_3767, partial [Escherichia coli 0.1288]